MIEVDTNQTNLDVELEGLVVLAKQDQSLA